jgi:hypothetical protein
MVSQTTEIIEQPHKWINILLRVILKNNFLKIKINIPDNQLHNYQIKLKLQQILNLIKARKN